MTYENEATCHETPTTDPRVLDCKLAALQDELRAHERIAVAFSGGVDSTFLLAVAHDVLGDDVLAVTGRSPSVPTREIEAARAFCRERGIRHKVVDTHEFEIEGFQLNPPDRCYVCKKEIFARLVDAAAEDGITLLAEGSNVDDEGDYRPGSRAVGEVGAISPLRQAGLTKADIRALARRLGLAVWNKPAFACLNTRFAYGDPITPDRLAQVDAAEEAIRALGFTQVRVRVQDKMARIEVAPDEIGRIAAADTRVMVVGALKGLGFTYVTLDLQGYRVGSMNEALDMRQGMMLKSE